MPFRLVSKFSPTGDQPQAIDRLTRGLFARLPHQVLLGVTGSGKTFTVANVVAKVNRPTLMIAHNKTLAAQLASELRGFFPDNAVHYFVSYYDYYQPEAYLPASDTYIEKDSSVNAEIDRLRNSATHALMTRDDVIIVASVSCIYGLGNPEVYVQSHLHLEVGGKLTQRELLKKLVELRYRRNDLAFERGRFRVSGETVDIHPSYGREAYRVVLFGSEIERIYSFDPATGVKGPLYPGLDLYPATHFLTGDRSVASVLNQIREDLERRLTELKAAGQLLEAERLRQRTENDLEMIAETGYTNGIENYSLYFDGRVPGEPPATLVDYFRFRSRRHTHPKGVRTTHPPGGQNDWLLILDESHQTVPQLNGMYEGDRSRKTVLVEHGFRLPTALDNRPLRFEEFEARMPQVIYTSATPGTYELGKIQATGNTRRVSDPAPTLRVEKAATGLVEMIVRPTGLLDPAVEIRKTDGQIEDLISEIETRVKLRERVLVTTLTKRMAEDLTEHLLLNNLKVQYLHSDVLTLERTEILRDLRLGVYDVVVGINLLREGLDLPEVSLVLILDADKEGFLRSEVSLIQTFGRAARHKNGTVLLYADHETQAMQGAIHETKRRRAIQENYNKEHGITPASIRKDVAGSMRTELKEELKKVETLKHHLLPQEEKTRLIRDLRDQMELSAQNLEFEKAALLRDQIRDLKRLKTAKAPVS